MDQVLFKHIDSMTDDLNDDLCSGFAVKQLELAAAYVDHVWACASLSFPPSFKFEGSAWCTPEEEFKELIQPRYGNTRGTYELAQSYLTLRKYAFTFEGESVPLRYFYLPFAEKGGLIKLRGPTYTISPVLADIAISPTKNGIFMALTRDLLTFERLPYSFIADGRVQSSYVVWSAVHASAEQNPKKVAMMSTLVHYLFCKYGVTEAFRRYLGINVIVGTMTSPNITELDKEKWVLCTTTGVTPRLHARRAYRPTQAVIAIPRAQFDHTATLFAAGFFYVIDHFPERFKPEYVDTDRFWRILMGHVIYRNGTNEGKLASDVDTHMSSLDKYVDEMVRESLRKGGIDCSDDYSIYDFFAHVVRHISDIVMNADLATMYGKQLFVLRYVMMKIRSQIFLMTYKLNGNNKKPLTRKDVIKIMGQFLNRELIFDLTKDHGEVSIVQAPGSCMLMKHTTNLVMQADATKGRGRRNKGNTNDISRIFHYSIPAVGSIFNQPKSEPTGRSRGNVRMRTDQDGVVLQDPIQMQILSKIQQFTKR